MSVEVFMPRVNGKLPVRLGKLLGAGQFLDLQADRLAQFHAVFHVENRLTAAASHMDMNRPVLIAVEEEPVSIDFEEFRHGWQD